MLWFLALIGGALSTLAVHSYGSPGLILPAAGTPLALAAARRCLAKAARLRCR